jgi:hypothetical protein
MLQQHETKILNTGILYTKLRHHGSQERHMNKDSFCFTVGKALAKNDLHKVVVQVMTTAIFSTQMANIIVA